jgi:hypothetical protein
LDIYANLNIAINNIIIIYLKKMDFGPVITPNGCIRFIYSEEYKFLSGGLGYDSCSYELELKKDNEKIVCEYDMETLKQIPGLKNEVKDGIMTLQYREYGFELNIKFKVDPLMYYPQLSKNKNAVILQTKHINNLENKTTFGIYMYDFKGVMLYSILETSLDKSDYYCYENYSIIYDGEQVIIYIWDHMTNKLINIFESEHYIEITHIGHDGLHDVFIIYDDDSEDLFILYVNKLSPSEYILRELPNIHKLCDKYTETILSPRFVQFHGYKYTLLWSICKTLNGKKIVIMDPIKLKIIEEIDYIGYDQHQIGDKIIYNSNSSEENVYMVIDLNKGTDRPLKYYIPEDQLLDIPMDSVNPVGLNKCWLTYRVMDYLEYKIVDFNH